MNHLDKSGNETSARLIDLRSFGFTDTGPVRANNEDLIHFDDGKGVYFVIDGMGGEAAGEIAAKIAFTQLRGRLEDVTGTPEERVRAAIILANEAILEASQTRADWKGMGCVVTVALVTEGLVTVGHVGDSRLYLVTHWNLQKLTHDHSPIGELEDQGELSEKEAMRHPRRNEVYRDLGSSHHKEDDVDYIDISEFPLNPQSAMLLCTDGLSDALSSNEILQIIRDNAGNRETLVHELILAAAREGKDNISAIFVEGPDFAAIPQSMVAQSPQPLALAETLEGSDTATRTALPLPVSQDDGAAIPSNFTSPKPKRLFFLRHIPWALVGALVGAFGAGLASSALYSYHTCQGRSKTRPLRRSKSWPVDI